MTHRASCLSMFGNNPKYLYIAFEAVHTSYFYPGKLFLDAPGLMRYWHGNEVKFRGFFSGRK